jgi:hypothetical protein
MSTMTVRVRSTASALKRFIRDIPGYCSGRLADSFGIGRSFKREFCTSFLEKVSEAYEVKSAGGTDDLGVKWRALKRATIAQRPTTPGERKKLGIKPDERHRGLLNDSQIKQWRAIFRHNFVRLVSRVGEHQAKILASKIAWAALKAQGAKTKLEVLGSRNVPINRVTDALYRSFLPNSGSPDQVFEVDHNGEMRAGSKVPYAKYVNRSRPIIPKDHGKWDNYAAMKGTESIIPIVVRSMQ